VTRPVLFDLFCGAGGAGAGYDRAGFRVIGVDNRPMPRYPFEFVQADAMQVAQYLADHAEPWPGAPRPAAVHASPPCQDHIRGGMRGSHGTGWMLAATRDRLSDAGVPWVIENVPGAPMRADLELCGCMFGLGDGSRGLRRPRWFETSWHAFDLRPGCNHAGRAITVAGHGAQGSWEYVDGVAPTQADRRRAMGIEWMNRTELAQAIPPVFTEYVGGLLLEHITAERAA
jgi:DNA (cytosine-5)-methyltransferase 1